MSGLDIYILILCLIVFSLFTILFSVMLSYIVKQKLRTIEHGLDDDKITTEYQKDLATSKAVKIATKVVTGVILGVLCVIFAFSAVMHIRSKGIPKGNRTVPKVVMSSSMAYKHKENIYLEKNGLHDQFQTFDLIFVRELPDEFDLELYDIVVYDYYGELIIHRIIGIEEPNEEHPEQRKFLLRGDASKYSDEFPVMYNQMQAIYEGDRIPFVGSFFAFMQSPAGYLCILLVLIAMIATPIAERKLQEAKMARLIEIGVATQQQGPKKKLSDVLRKKLLKDEKTKAEKREKKKQKEEQRKKEKQNKAEKDSSQQDPPEVNG